MVSRCVVKGCKNKGSHRFPKDDVRKTQWVRAITVQPGLSIRNHSLICSAHFRPSDFSVTPSSFTKLDRANKILKKSAIPSIFPWTVTSNQQNITPHEGHSSSPQLVFDSSNIKATYSRAPPTSYVEMQPFLNIQSEIEKIDDPLQLPDDEPEESQDHELIETESVENIIPFYLTEEEPGTDFYQEAEIAVTEISTKLVHTHSQTELEKCNKPSQQQTTSRETQTLDCGTGFSIHNVMKNEKPLHFYTGLENFEKFMLIFHTLGKCAYNLKYFYGPPPERVGVLEQYFITLIILRRHKTFEDISMMFGITLKHVYSIFITWIKFMSLQWKKLDLWISRETVAAFIPFDFYEKYPATRLILDATECPVKKPKLPFAQQVTFSSYKNRNTVKFLIGITPGGLISYISPSYGGSATDRQILERSHILNKFDYNDEIMVDKGFNVQDIFVPFGVKVNMPAFFRKGNQIDPQVLSTNRKVASKRVHVERVIGMLKTYKILTEPMNQTEILLSSDIALIIAMLVNFRSNIINKNA